MPFAEELTYRGLGYSLLIPFGRWPTIFLVGLLFGLAHGLLVSLPIIVAFGCALAWIRDRTDSVVPGMFAARHLQPDRARRRGDRDGEVTAVAVAVNV